MALNYDFDMLSMTADVTPEDAGTETHPTGKPVALFRHAETIEALERAPQAVQDYLRASCFGINCYHSGAPAGRYPAADEAARIAVIEALAENVRRFDLPRADDSQPDADTFHLASFFAAVAEAEPIAMEPVAMAKAEPAATDMAAQAVAEMIAMETASEPEAESASEFTPVLAEETDTLISSLILSQDMRVDLLAAAPRANDNLIAEMFAEAAAVADAETPDAAELLPHHVVAKRGFRLPALPRWMTAGAAFVVLGVALGSAVI